MCERLDDSSEFLAKHVHDLQTHRVSQQLAHCMTDNADVAIDAIRSVLETADYDRLQELNQTIHRLMHK